MPVESRGINLLTDVEGNVIEISGKYLDPAEMDTEVLISADEAGQAIKDWFDSEEVRQIGGGCVIYTAGEKAQAAWKSVAFADGAVYQCYVSARDGTVLSVNPQEYEESAVGTWEDADGNLLKFKTEKVNDTYLLEDEESWIRVYDLKSTAENPGFYIRPAFTGGDVFFAKFDKNDRWDPEGKKGFPILLNNQEDPSHDYRMVQMNDRLAVTDNGAVLYPDVYVEIFFRKDQETRFEVLSDADNKWEDERAAQAMKNLQDSVRYWREVLGRNSYNDHNTPLAFCLNGDTDNAATRVWPVILYCYSTGLIKISPTYPVTLNVLAHEFTHAVIQSRVQLGDGYTYPEASAINEGLADLFSELTEDYIKEGDCDWNLESRNAKDPLSTGNPVCYQGKNWKYKCVAQASTDDERKINGTYAHQNSTIISHMGYLIATGDLEKPEHTTALGTDLTARLFYSTFLELYTETNFSEYATVLYRCAVLMYQNGLLSAENVRCVYRAIEEVGLLPAFGVANGGAVALKYLNNEDLSNYSVDIYTVDRISLKDGFTDVVYEDDQHHSHADVLNPTDTSIALPQPAEYGAGKTCYKYVIVNKETENEEFSFLLCPGRGAARCSIPTPFLDHSELYYNYLRDTYGTEDSDLVSAYIMDFDLDGRNDLLTVTKGRVILANTPLGAFDLYDGKTEAATLDLTMYQLDEKNDVVKTGAILGAGTIEGHSSGRMSISIVMQDGKPYICGLSENEDDTTYGARPYVIYEIIEGGGFQYDYVDGITWGQYVMGVSDNKDPNKVAATYGLDVSGTQLSERGKYGVVLCEATADNRKGPGTISATDYTQVKEGMKNGYKAVKEQLDAMHEEMVLDAKAFEERQEAAKNTESLFEVFVKELDEAGAALTLKEYRTREDTVIGVYTCKDVDIWVSIDGPSGKLLEIELSADGFPVPDSWYPVKDAVLSSTFAGLDQTLIGELLGQTPSNLGGRFDAGPAEILAGNTDTIILRIMYK